MRNWGTHNPFSQLGLASGLVLLAACNGGFIGNEGTDPLLAGD